MQILPSKLFRLFLNKQIIHPPHPLQSEARTDYVGTLLEFRAQLSTVSHRVLCKQSKRKFLPHRGSSIKKSYHRDHRKLETEMRQLQTRASRTEFNFFKFMSVHFSQTVSKRDKSGSFQMGKLSTVKKHLRISCRYRATAEETWSTETFLIISHAHKPSPIPRETLLHLSGHLNGNHVQ